MAVYLVMEYIDSKFTSATGAPEKVADAPIQWLYYNLFVVFLPLLVLIGHLGGGLARHRLFQDREAPLPFSGKEAAKVHEQCMSMQHAFVLFNFDCQPLTSNL